MTEPIPAQNPWYKRYSKALAALLGTLTPTGLIAVLATADIHLDPALAAGLVTIAGVLATWLAPANKQ